MCPIQRTEIDTIVCVSKGDWWKELYHLFSLVRKIRSLDEAPIKLMFPRGQNGCGDLEFSMLGLGDIVVRIRTPTVISI